LEASFIFAASAEANYITRFIDARISYINHIPIELLRRFIILWGNSPINITYSWTTRTKASKYSTQLIAKVSNGIVSLPKTTDRAGITSKQHVWWTATVKIDQSVRSMDSISSRITASGYQAGRWSGYGLLRSGAYGHRSGCSYCYRKQCLCPVLVCEEALRQGISIKDLYC